MPANVITHKNLQPWLDRLQAVDFLKCKISEGGWTLSKPDPNSWIYQEVVLEFPLGELAKDGLTTLALVGKQRPPVVDLTGKEGFNAQGLEGKVQIKKPLLNALFNMRDILPLRRGRILLPAQQHGSNPPDCPTDLIHSVVSSYGVSDINDGQPVIALRLGNVQFWIDSSGPFKDRLSYDQPTSRWNTDAIAKQVARLLKKRGEK